MSPSSSTKISPAERRAPPPRQTHRDRLLQTRTADACQSAQPNSIRPDLLCSVHSTPLLILATRLTRCTAGGAHFSSQLDEGLAPRLSSYRSRSSLVESLQRRARTKAWLWAPLLDEECPFLAQRRARRSPMMPRIPLELARSAIPARLDLRFRRYQDSASWRARRDRRETSVLASRTDEDTNSTSEADTSTLHGGWLSFPHHDAKEPRQRRCTPSSLCLSADEESRRSTTFRSFSAVTPGGEDNKGFSSQTAASTFQKHHTKSNFSSRIRVSPLIRNRFPDSTSLFNNESQVAQFPTLRQPSTPTAFSQKSSSSPRETEKKINCNAFS